MIQDKNIFGDLHTHTIYSKHGYSTFKENIDMAKKRGLSHIAITDHFYGNGDSIEQKNEISRIEYMNDNITCFERGITIVPGAEFNLNQMVDNKKLANLLWKPIGFHSWFLDKKSVTLDKLLELYMDSTKQGVRNNVFAHIEREIDKIDNGKYKDQLPNEVKAFFDSIIEFSKENEIILELNETSLRLNECGCENRIRYWLKRAKENRNKICLGTDAHYYRQIGNFTNTIKILNEIDYPKELILNCDIDWMEEMFKNVKENL